MNRMGQIIKKLRIENQMTQEELGKIIGVQKSAIRKYEKGDVENIKRTSIIKMAKCFNVSPCYLMGFEDNSIILGNNSINGNNNNYNYNNGNINIENNLNNQIDKLKLEETELLRIYRILTLRDKTSLLNFAYDLEEKQKKSEGNEAFGISDK